MSETESVRNTAHRESEIWIRGAREHNLRGFDLRIPRDAMVVITGPSGSGKSSLAFDTLYAEGQRRYVESLSVYARQFLDQLSRPDVDAIEGLSPAIAIEQRGVGRNSRSTVGTATEIYDYLRLLFARVGEVHCWQCDRPISSQSVEQMCERLLALEEATAIEVLAPLVRGRKGSYKKEIADLRRQGYTQVRIDGETRDLAGDISLARHERHDIAVRIDRIVIKERARTRIAEALETAMRLADGQILIDVGPGDDEWWLSKRNACVPCGLSFPEIAPRLFSFNSRGGACGACGGMGTRLRFDPSLVVPDGRKPLRSAIAPWVRGGRTAKYYRHLLASLARHFDVAVETPWDKLPSKVRRRILHGTRDAVEFRMGRARGARITRTWDGVLGELERKRQERSEEGANDASRYATPDVCDQCDGSRLRVEARAIRIGGRAIHEVCALPVSDAAAFFCDLSLSANQRLVAERVHSEICERLRFLCEVGLGYLTLARPSPTLSGGESQRIRLATQVGANLLGVLYVLDEPSIGLHSRDNGRLRKSLRRLQTQGNSVVIVEHDEETIRDADWVIDMGPGAGREGGAIIACGDPETIAKHPDSPTGAFLSGRRRVEREAPRREAGDRWISLRGCREHNLQAVDLELPLGLLIGVSGVSGSGKSTLIHDTLYRALARDLHDATPRVGDYDTLRGSEAIDRVVLVDQSPIGRTPRSNAATYTGVFDGIRKLFSGVPEARMRGYGPGRFSFNVKGGRCESCRGDGALRVEMHFLPDLFVTCQVCGGRRYNRETLEIQYRRKNIADVLAMTVEQALEFAENVQAIRRPLQTLFDVGLDYLHLGQAATTLSGGEAQRIKLARELGRRDSGRSLYLLDEPTTGLHFADVERLLGVLDRLVAAGNTVVVIEHQLDVLKNTDWIIDLGPEGGKGGGRIVAAGPPESIAACVESFTGQALREAQQR